MCALHSDPKNTAGVFGFGQDCAVEKAPPNAGTEAYFVVRTNERKYTLNRIDKNTVDETTLKTRLLLHEHLAGRGLPVGAPFKTAAGEYVHDEREFFWYCVDLLEGEAYFGVSPELIHEVGVTLGEYHRKSADFPFADRLTPVEFERYAKRDLRKRLEASGGLPKDVCDEIGRIIDEAYVLLTPEKFSRLPHTCIHGEVEASSFVFKDGKISGINTIPFPAWQPAVTDLAYAMTLFKPDEALKFEEGEALLKGYRQSRELTADEGRALKPMMALHLTEKIVFDALYAGTFSQPWFVLLKRLMGRH